MGLFLTLVVYCLHPFLLYSSSLWAYFLTLAVYLLFSFAPAVYPLSSFTPAVYPLSSFTPAVYPLSSLTPAVYPLSSFTPAVSRHLFLYSSCLHPFLLYSSCLWASFLTIAVQPFPLNSCLYHSYLTQAVCILTPEMELFAPLTMYSRCLQPSTPGLLLSTSPTSPELQVSTHSCYFLFPPLPFPLLTSPRQLMS